MLGLRQLTDCCLVLGLIRDVTGRPLETVNSARPSPDSFRRFAQYLDCAGGNKQLYYGSLEQGILKGCYSALSQAESTSVFRHNSVPLELFVGPSLHSGKPLSPLSVLSALK